MARKPKKPQSLTIPFGKKVKKETTITCLVKCSLIISVGYDERIPSERRLKEDLMENFASHPSIDDPTERGRLTALDSYEVVQITED